MPTPAALEENLLLPTAVGVPRPSASCRRRWPRGDLRDRRAGPRGRLPRAQGLPPGAARRHAHPRGRRARARVELELVARGRAPTSTPSASRARFDDPAFRGQVVAQLARARLGAERAGRVPRRARHRRSARRLDRAGAARSGGRVFEVPTLPPSVPGMRVFALLREALRRAGGRMRLNNVVVGAERAGARVDARCACASGCARSATRADWIVLATGGFASGGLELDSHWSARDVALGLPSPACRRPGEERFTPGYFDEQPMSRAGVAVDDELRPLDAAARARTRTCSSPGATLAGAEPWKEKSGDGISLATGHRAAELVLAAGGAPPRRRPVRRAMTDVLGSLLMRESLDHCVKCTICETFCPVAERHPAVPGAEVRRAAGRALPRRRRAVRRRVGRLLLGLRDLHAGLPAGRAHRRDQHAGARAPQGDAGRSAARPPPRAADARSGGSARPSRRSPNWTLENRPLPPRRGEGRRRAPRRGVAEVRRPDVPALGAAATTRRRPRRGASPTSTAAGRTTTSRGWAR